MYEYRWLIPIAAALFAAVSGAQAYAHETKTIDNAELGNETDGTDWPAYGRTFSESRFSPLRQVNDANVSRLGLAWVVDLDVPNSITAPVEAGGIIYLAAGYSIVHAIRATDGHLLWRYDPKVPEASGQKLRAGWGIRGLALWKDKVYVGTQDGRVVEAGRRRQCLELDDVRPGVQSTVLRNRQRGSLKLENPQSRGRR